MALSDVQQADHAWLQSSFVTPISPSKAFSETTQEDKLGILWQAILKETQQIQYRFYDESAHTNSANHDQRQPICIGSKEQGVTARWNQQGQPLNANHVDINAPDSTSWRRYVAGKTPSDDSQALAMLIDSFEHRRDIFQFTSKADDQRSLVQWVQRQVIDQQQAWHNLGKYCLKKPERITSPHAGSDAIQTWRMEVLPAIYAHESASIQREKSFFMYFTEATLPFEQQVLDAASIEAANEALEIQQQTRLNQQSTRAIIPPPMILSPGGVGRNASLMVYREMMAWIHDQYQKKATLTDQSMDEKLLSLINIGRQSRGPHFIHSQRQLKALREAIDRYRDMYEQLGPFDHDSHFSSDQFQLSQLKGDIQFDRTHHLLRGKTGCFKQEIATAFSSDSRMPTSKEPRRTGLSDTESRISGDSKKHQLGFVTQAPKESRSASWTTIADSANASLQHMAHRQLRLRDHSSSDETLWLQALLLMQVVTSQTSSSDTLKPLKAMANLLEFDPFLHMQSYAKTDPLSRKIIKDHSVSWKMIWQLLDIPGGRHVLTSLWSERYEEKKCHQYLDDLEILAKARKQLMVQKINHGTFSDDASLIHPAQLYREARYDESIAGKAVIALMSRLSSVLPGGLSNHQQTADDWTITVVKNDLFDENGAEFRAIEKHLEKFRTWAERLHRPKQRPLTSWFVRCNPFKKKSPFRAMKHGLQGVDLGGAAAAGAVKAKHDQHARFGYENDVDNKTIIKSSKTTYRIHSTDDVNRIFQRIVKHIEGASRLRLYEGGTIGFGLKGLTGSLVSLVSGFLLRLRVDVRWSASRQACFEIAMPPYNLEMTIGTTKTRHCQAGVGAAFGPNVAGVAALTAGIDVNVHSAEQMVTQGICIRLPRIRGQEQLVRDQSSQLIEDLLHQPKPISLDVQRQSTLTYLLGKYPDLTVNIIGDYHFDQNRRGANLELAASVGEFACKGFVGAGVGVDKTTKLKRHYHDQTGHLRVVRRLGGVCLRGFGFVRAGIRPGIVGDQAVLGVPIPEVFQANRDFFLAGQTTRQELAIQQGHFHNQSFVEFELQTQRAFLEYLSANRQQWEALKTKEKLDKLIADVKADPDKNLTYAVRYEIKPEEAKKIELMQSILREQQERDPKDLSGRSRALAKDIDHCLNALSTYQPASFRVYQRSERQSRRGLFSLIHLHRNRVAEGVYAKYRLM